MRRTYGSGASATPPNPPASPSHGFPQTGNPTIPVAATRPTAWWYHMITEELMSVIEAAGLTGVHTTLNQLLTALRSTGVFQTAAQFVSNTAAATTAFVQRALGNRQNVILDSALTRSVVAGESGSLIMFAGVSTGDGTWGLPLVSTLGDGANYCFINLSGYILTINVAGSDTISVGTDLSLSTIKLFPRDTLSVTAKKVGDRWHAEHGTAISRQVAGNFSIMELSTLTSRSFGINDTGGAYCLASAATADAVWNLPPTDGVMPSGTAFRFVNDNTTFKLRVRANTATSDKIRVGATTRDYVDLLPGQTLELCAGLTTYWRVTGGSAQLAYDPGFYSTDEIQCFPNGNMIQIFEASVSSAGTDESVSFPQAFVGAAKQVIVCDGNVSGGSNLAYAGTDSYTASAFKVKISSGSGTFRFIAIGRWK